MHKQALGKLVESPSGRQHLEVIKLLKLNIFVVDLRFRSKKHLIPTTGISLCFHKPGSVEKALDENQIAGTDFPVCAESAKNLWVGVQAINRL